MVLKIYICVAFNNHGMLTCEFHRWVWSFAGEQAGLEESVEMGGAGYPALVALNMKKSAVSHMRSGFSKEFINEFLG